MAEMAENQDLGRGPPNITSSGSLEIVGLSTLIYERLKEASERFGELAFLDSLVVTDQ